VSQYPKAIVGRSEIQVKNAMRALDLKEPEWFPMIIWQAVAGRRFSRIVYLDLDPASPEEERQMIRRQNDLRCRLMPEDQDQIWSL
jgi:hypothetical protein